MMEAKSIERIAEELGVNFYDLHPLISARDEAEFKAGQREVVEWVKAGGYLMGDKWEAQQKEWGL